MGAVPAPEASIKTAAIVLAVCFACNMLGRGVGDTFMVFVLPLSEQFGWGRAEVSSVYSVYLVATGLSAPLTGVLIDRWGPRVVYPLGMILLGGGCLAAGSVDRLWQFYACIGILGGMGISMLGMVPASMMISRWFRERMSTAMGVAYAGFGIGSLLVVPLAERSIDLVGWRDTYRLIGGAVLVLMPLLFLLPWNAMMGARSVRREPAAVRIAGLRAALRSRAYWQIVQLFAFTSFGMYAVLAQVVPFLVQSGLTPFEAASAFGIAGLLSVFGIMASGWAADRFGHRATATTSFVSTFLGIAALLAIAVEPARWLVVAFVVCFGLSQGARGPIVSSLAARHFGGAGFATIYGTMFACMSVAGALGSLVSGLLYDLSGGYRAGFVFSMMCVLLAVSPFWVSRPLRASSTPPA